jgi:tetratricopeptide (TPR) repeat protein
MIQSERFLLCVFVFALGGLSGWAAGPTIQPVFPPENENLVFIEGEDAVATNFAREPTFNFGASGYRTLQLNQAAGIQGIGTFYADYVFSVPVDGEWELWYGGTPPGPRDELSASYASPLVITFDERKPLPRYREDVAVVENYSPAFYWNRAASVKLGAGRHTLRFEIAEKRRYDGRYYFYLDCFFLVRTENSKRVLSGPVPPVFPLNMDDRSIDTPYLSIDDYLIRIRDSAVRKQPLVEISRVYSLLGDYLNALKYLNKAALLQPNDTAIGLLVAKNRIWKGDIAEGLHRYRELLTADPKHREVWLEAGKVAAWSGRYDDSIGFFKDGLTVFADDADLMINLGLTYVWAGRGADGEIMFRAAQTLAGSDPEKLKNIGRVYAVNGYPDRAAAAYAAAAAADPRDLESRMLLIDTQLALGN